MPPSIAVAVSVLPSRFTRIVTTSAFGIDPGGSETYTTLLWVELATLAAARELDPATAACGAETTNADGGNPECLVSTPVASGVQPNPAPATRRPASACAMHRPFSRLCNLAPLRVMLTLE